MISTKNPPKITEKSPMKEIRSHLLNILPEPKGWVKTDIYVYKHGAGRVNFWNTTPDSSNLDIVSYYFTYNSEEIVVHTDEKTIKIVKI